VARSLEAPNSRLHCPRYVLLVVATVEVNEFVSQKYGKDQMCSASINAIISFFLSKE
jgi:hypothetical protein